MQPLCVPYSATYSTIQTQCVLVFTALKKHYDHGNSYLKEHLIEVALLQFHKFSPLSLWQETWKYAGRGCTGTESTISLSEDSRESTNSHSNGSLSKRILQAHPHSDTLPPKRTCLLIVPLPFGATFFQTTTLHSLAPKLVRRFIMSYHNVKIHSV